MYDLSDKTAAVFERVIRQRVMQDSRNKPGLSSYRDWFGYPSSYIRETVTNYGRADFTQGYDSDLGSLSAEDCCLLYSFFFARMHCKQLRDLLARHGAESGLPAAQPVLFIDLGCGPATALMAYADTYPGTAIDYIAVDRAERMTELAQQIFLGLREEGVIAATSTFRREESCVNMAVELGKPTVIAASFLFASVTLPGQRDSLCDLVHSLAQNNKGAGIAFVYTNSDAQRAELEWTQFKEKMRWKGPLSSLEVEGESGMRYSGSITYKKRSP